MNTAREIVLDSFKLTENLLEALSETNKVKVPEAHGILTDVAIVGITTFVGSLVGGSWGAVAGGALGTGILVSRYMLKNEKYKPLMEVLREDLTEEERNSLYKRIWEKLEVFTTPSSNQLMYSAELELKKTVEENPDLTKNIENELNETLDKKKMILV